jgi:hypothetical protein
MPRAKNLKRSQNPSIRSRTAAQAFAPRGVFAPNPISRRVLKPARLFSLIPQPQEPGHCGPTSLSSCLAILGRNADQRQLARAMHKPFRTYKDGVDEIDIRQAARRYGVRTELLARFDREEGALFVRRLKSHLRRGLPCVLLVQSFGHWVALVGYVEAKDQIIVMDPDDRRHAFNRWSDRTLLSKAWNVGPWTGQPSQYFAILARRYDGRQPKWRITESFARLCAMGSEQTADEMVRDLIEMARRARAEAGEDSKGPFLEKVLARHRRVVVSSVEHWAAYSRREVKPGSLRALYRDYSVVAAAAGIRLAKNVDPSAIVAQMTTVLTTYAWTGSL